MAPALSAASAATIKKTAPCLESKANQLASKMYTNLFAAHPEMKAEFNDSAHAAGGDGFSVQDKALGVALVAFAKNCDDPAALAPVVAKIGARHTKENVKAERFAVLGETLLGAMKEVMGSDCNDEVLGAWKEGYGVLAALIQEQTK